LPRYPVMIRHRSRPICSCACRVCLAIFEMADTREGESHVDVSLDIEGVVDHKFLR
jgi:hypothetical protein